MKLIRILSYVRAALVPLALAKILLDRNEFPSGYETAAWGLLGAQALVAVGLLALAYAWNGRLRRLAALNVLADGALAFGLMLVYAWEPGQPLRSLLFLVVLEAALFFRLRGGLAAGALTTPLLVVAEIVRDREFGYMFQLESIVLRVLVALALGAVIGRLVELERGQARAAEERAAEAERLRDQLGRRIDVLEATSRATRALGSSLELDAAFEAFVQELRGLLPFDRAAIVLVEGSGARVMATAGVGADEFLGPGTAIGMPGSILEEVIGEGRTIYRDDIAEQRYPEEAGLLELGIRSRVLAPLQLGLRSVGALAISRTEPTSFRPDEVELVTLLGRLVATAVENLRIHEAERATVDELRRLSSLRADFVSLPHVRGDAERLRQLIDNLISNAVKYSDAGAEVSVQAQADDGQVVLRVRDTGPGIAGEHQGQIFEKFGRAAGSAKPGTGLGLFLARSFAEAHGGSLTVESRPGEGATFTLTLPTGAG